MSPHEEHGICYLWEYVDIELIGLLSSVRLAVDAGLID